MKLLEVTGRLELLGKVGNSPRCCAIVWGKISWRSQLPLWRRLWSMLHPWECTPQAALAFGWALS